MSQWRSPEYKMKCDVCGVEAEIALLPKGWTMITGLTETGQVDFVHAKHYCPEHKEHAKR